MEKIDLELDSSSDDNNIDNEGKEKLSLNGDIVDNQYDLTKRESGRWEDTWIYSQYKKRVRQDRDIKIGIIAEDGETGVSKTTLALYLAIKMDENGFSADKVALDGNELLDLMNIQDGVPYNSAVIADEIQKVADTRRSMSTVNVQLTQAIDMARFRQAYFIYTLPTWGSLDKRVRQSTNILIKCHKDQIGKATVYDIRLNDLDGGNIKTHKMETISYPDISDHPIYEEMEKYKEESFEKITSGEDLNAEDEDTEPTISKQKAKAKMEAVRVKSENPDMGARAVANKINEGKDEENSWGKSAVYNWLKDAGFY